MTDDLGKKRARNGELEFCRFFFCAAVLLFHAEKYFLGEPSLSSLRLSVFAHGALGVEFFFLCSGFLMARSVFRERQSGAGEISVGAGTLAFMRGKLRGIFPQHVVAFVFSLLSVYFRYSMSAKTAVVYTAKSLPSFFLIQMLGFDGKQPNHVEWYISVMLVCMLVIYPFLKKYYEYFAKAAAPVIALFILGYLYKTTGTLTGVKVWTGLVYKSMLRGFAEICGGIWLFEAARALKASEWTPGKRAAATVLSAGCLIGSFLLMVLTFPKNFEFFILPMAGVLIVVAYTEQSYLHRFFENSFARMLGKYSLPLYLCQCTMINLVCRYAPRAPFPRQIAIFLAGDCLLAVLCAAAAERLPRWLKRPRVSG